MNEAEQMWLRRWNFLRSTLLFIALLSIAILVTLLVGGGAAVVALVVGGIVMTAAVLSDWV